jgi:hypothetical protein
MQEKKRLNSWPRPSHSISPKGKIMDFRLDFAVTVISYLTITALYGHKASGYTKIESNDQGLVG